MLPIECVVRGYLAGSGWKDYQATGSTSGHALPEGLRESDRLPQPIFTPATKAQTGHDENISRDQAAELVGAERLAEVERIAIALYTFAAEHALASGIIIADTKFELGIDSEGDPRPRRRGADARLVPLLAGGHVRAGPRPGQLRQAVRPRLLRDDELEQDRARAGAPRRGGGGHALEVHRGVRAADDDPLPGVPGEPVGGDSREGDRPRPSEVGDPRPAGAGGRVGARASRVHGLRRARRQGDRPRGGRDRRRGGAGAGGADVRAAPRQPADRVLRDRGPG